MNHDGAVLLVVGSGVFKSETLRQVVIHLDCSKLPATSDGVFHHEVEFRSIECSLTKFGAGVKSFFGASFNDSLLSLCPVLIASHIFILVVGVAE